MRRIKTWVLIVCLSVTSVGCSLIGPSRVTRTVTFLHTADTHAQTLPGKNDVGGYATVSRFMRMYKADHDNVLILDSGDMITGTPVSTLFEGKPIFEIMNTMPYDVGLLGNHEFDHGWDKIDGFLEIYEAPLLNANLRKPSGELFGDGPVAYRMVNGVRVGIIGVLLSDFVEVTNTVGHQGLELTSATVAVGQYLPEVERNSDLVVVLSHCGLKEEKEMAEMYPQIDLILGGHSHKPLRRPIKVNQTVITHPGSYNQAVGVLKLKVDVASGTITSYRGRNVKMKIRKYPPDPVTYAVVRKWEDKVSTMVKVEIGHNKKSKRQQELTDIVAAVLKQKYKTDYGFQNRHGIRNWLPEGVILKEHIWKILPFINKIVILKLDREGLDRAHRLFAEKDQETGEETLLEYDKPAEDDPRTYFTFVTNDYVADIVIEDLELDDQYVTRYENLLAEEMMEYIQATGSFELPE